MSDLRDLWRHVKPSQQQHEQMAERTLAASRR